MLKMYIEGHDEKDEKILELLKSNGRMSYTDIAEKVQLTRVAVKNRVEKLEKDGVIKGYHAEIDKKASPDGMEFILDVAVIPEYFTEVSEDLSKEKIIRKLVILTGKTRLLAFGYAPNYQTLKAYTSVLYHRMRGIESISFQTVLSVLKDEDGGVEYEKQPGKGRII